MEFLNLCMHAGTEGECERVEIPDWQPIETAPKDGTVVLLWCKPPKNRGTRTRIARFAYNRWSSHSSCHALQPTHWMPLPDPPKDVQ